MFIRRTKGLCWLLVVGLLMGVISGNFSNTAYAAIPSGGIHEVPTAGGFKLPSVGGEFDNPQGIAVDSSGNVYVADFNNNRIQKFDSSGTFLMQWGEVGGGNGQFQYPSGIAVDNSGNVYVADLNNNRIQKFDSSGAFLTKWGSKGSGEGEFQSPQGIAVDTSDNVYVVDMDNDNNRIQKFDSSGTFLTQWGSKGSGDGQFIAPNGIAIDKSGHVYVVDADNQRIQKFDSSGKYMMQWGSKGSGNGQFEYPQGIAVDTSDNVYVADYSNNRIQKFDSSGTYVTQWGGVGSDSGQFQYPSGIAVDTSGNVFVADSRNSRIQKFDSSGKYVMQWGSYGSAFLEPSSIATDGSGNVYVGDINNQRIQKFDSSGTFVMKFGGYNSDNQDNSDFQGIAVDTNRNVYVVDSNNHWIQKFDSSGTLLKQWGSEGSGDGEFEYPQGIAVDMSGNVYVADSNNSRIQKFDSSGTFLKQWGSEGRGDGQFEYPHGIAVDTSGNVYVLDTNKNNSRIQKFDSSGAFLMKWGSKGSGDGQFQSPQGIAIDKSGYVYVADYNNNRIQKFDSSGTYLAQWGRVNSGDAPFLNPYGVTVDNRGNLYVLDINSNTRNRQFRKFGLNNNVHVTGLTLSAGTLSPAFKSDTTSYTASVAASVDAVTVTPMLDDPMAKVNVTAPSVTVTSTVYNNVTSFSVPLNVGENLITVTITAMDGTTTSAYTIDVTRMSSNVLLSGLTVDQGTLSPSFSPLEPTYKVDVANTVTSLNLSLTKADPTETLTVTGAVYRNIPGNVYSYHASDLMVGPNRIDIVVTAQDGTTKTYTVTVTRAQAPSTDVGLPIPPTPSSDKVTSKDGKLTLPVGKSGEVSLGDEVTITIPANAIDKELKVTIEKGLDLQKLLTNHEVLASSIFEITKNVPENFNKPVTLTFLFDSASLKSNQKASVFYYDEAKKSWVEVGGIVNGNHIRVEVNHFTKYAVFAVGGQPAEVSFSDITGHWAEANIKQAVKSGIVSGYPDGRFKPNATVTRAEFAVMLMNTLKPQGEGAALTFTDSAKIGSWAQKAVAQAVQAGITKGYEDGTFRPDAGITRSEMAMMIVNALGQPIDEAATTGFADDKAIPKWATSAVAAMKKLGMITGKSMNKFAPNDQATRAEAVTVLLKMMEQKSK